ncbi:MAG: hypothetical protein WBO23_18565 [Burkholderiales bacterium]
MDGVLEDFLRWFWISSAMTIFFGGVLFIATRRRELWLRYIAAEASFWTRIGVPAWIVDSSRRFEANRIFTGFLWLVAVSSFLLVLGNGAAYLYFKGKVPSVAQPEAAPGTDAAHAPRAG